MPRQGHAKATRLRGYVLAKDFSNRLLSFQFLYFLSRIELYIADISNNSESSTHRSISESPTMPPKRAQTDASTNTPESETTDERYERLQLQVRAQRRLIEIQEMEEELR